MRMLRAIYFINSANIPYAEIPLDGNAHIAGTNGAGKSTILRAILFFYTANTRQLGLQKEQKIFSDFYLKHPNSYIVYEILKESETYLAVAFRSQNRACFRFVKTPFLRELFLDESHQARHPQDLVRVMNARQLSHSAIIPQHRHFKEIIYGVPSDMKNRAFSLFESKSYENIPRTISNIFLNYKLESDFIKTSVIYSLVEDEKLYEINLSAIQEPLGKIDGYLMDIDLYEGHEQIAKDIVSQYERILVIETDKCHLAEQLGGSVKFAEVEQKGIGEKINFFHAEIKKLQTKLEDLDRQFQEKRDAFVSRIGVLSNNLKEAKEKQRYYQSINIEQILEKVQQKEFHEKSLAALQQQKSLLLDKAQDIESAFNAQISQLEHDRQELVFTIEQERLQTEKTAEQKKRAQEELSRKNVQQQNETYQHKVDKLEQRLEECKKALQVLELHRKDVQHSHPLQREIEEFEGRIRELQTTLNTHKFAMNDHKNSIGLAQKEIEHTEREEKGRIERCQEAHQREKDALEERLDAVKQKLELADDSFLAFLEASHPGYKETIAKVCREDLFLRNDLSPEIIREDNLSLFGVSLDVANLDRVIHDREEYERRKTELETELQQLGERYQNSVAEIREETAREIEIQQKGIGKCNKAIVKLEKQDREDNFRLQQCQHQITLLKEKEAEQKRQKLEQIDRELLDEREKRTRIDEEITRQKARHREERDRFESEKNRQLAVIDAELQQQLEGFFSRQQTIREDYIRRIADLQEQKKAALRDEGVDTQKVDDIEKQIAAEQDALKFIRTHETTAIEYRKDRREHIDKIPECEAQKTELTQKKQELSRRYEAVKERITTQQQQKDELLREKQQRLDELRRGREVFDEFKHSPLYEELRQRIEESFYESRESISQLIHQLNLKDQNFQRRRETIVEQMTEFAGRFRADNIFDFHFTRSGSREQDFRFFAQGLKDFVEEGRIAKFKREVNVHYGLLMRNLSKQFNDLNSKAGDIQRAIGKINQDFERSNFVGAIKRIQLRFRDSDNRIVNCLRHIAEFVSENPFAGEEPTLFNQQTQANQEKDRKAIDLLNHLRKNLERTSQQVISLGDSFKLEFRVVENDNDTQFVEKLSRAGSEGTDILIKAMIYITLLDVAKEQFSKRVKEYKIHCIIDEVGKLANNYLKELIDFANSKDILLINGSPNIIDPLAYNKVYHVSKDTNNNSIVKKILAERQ